MKVFLALLTYLFSLVLTAVVAFVIVLVLAGPHAGLLPGWLEAVVLALGWLAVFVVPIFPTRAVWRRVARSASGQQPSES